MRRARLQGASLISISRVSAAALHQGADVGGDLVGKVEAGVPEDDPRNPATIADDVGVLVGVAPARYGGRLFESLCGAAVATMVLAAIFFAKTPILMNMMTLPLAISGICIITSIIGHFSSGLGANQSIMGTPLFQGLDRQRRPVALVGVAAVIYSLIGFGELCRRRLAAWRCSCGVIA